VSHPPLPGHGSSSAVDVAVLPNGYAMLAGTSYASSTDPNGTGEATLWIVDTSTDTIVGTLRMSDLAQGLSAGDVPRVLTSFRVSPGDGLAVHAVSGTKLGGGPRRWLMTEVPWNRRVDDIAIVPSGAGSFDVTVDWRIDLGGSVAVDTELGAAVGLEIDTVPETPADTDECLIWDLGSGGGYSCEALPGGAPCGTAMSNSVAVTLTCDGDTGTCGVDLTTVFPGVSLVPGDSVLGTLTRLATAEAEIVVEDDSLEVIHGSAVPLFGAGGLATLALSIAASGSFGARKRSHSLVADGSND
jgi:hypothetical protein